jgi:hypothetical protein
MTRFNGLVAVGILLLIVWVFAAITKFVVGALLYVLLIAGVILLAIGIFRRVV